MCSVCACVRGVCQVCVHVCQVVHMCVFSVCTYVFGVCVSGVRCVCVVSVCVGERGETEIRQAEPYETTLYSGRCQCFDTRQKYPEQKREGNH